MAAKDEERQKETCLRGEKAAALQRDAEERTDRQKEIGQISGLKLVYSFKCTTLF